MPRDGSHQYHVPPGTPGIPDTPVASTPYNAFLSDLEADLNLPRPIEVGGSGASSADGALDNLSAEKFKQVVANWDTMVWRAGSFFALANATGIAPGGFNTHAFAGIAYYANATDFVVEATDLATGTKYIRYMTAGVWGAWAAINAAVADALYVKKAGDTMTGPLALPAAAPTLGPQATNKTYVDAGDAAAMTAINDALTTKAVRYDIAQALTSDTPPATMGQRSQARSNIYAAPFDALAFSGMQVNGSMEVSQERAAGQVTPNVGYVADGNWRFAYSGSTMVVRSYLAASSIPGLPNYLAMDVTTAQGALAAGDYAETYNSIEGYRISRLAWGTANAQPITLAFWSAHHRTGIYTGAIRNAAATRSYVFSYTHAVADAPQYNVVTVPGCPDGVWLADNGVGMVIIFPMSFGATLTAPSLNSWLAGAFVGGPGQVNAVGATSDIFRITGVVILPGIEAPSAARSPLIMRPYDQELLTCQRYWEKSYDYAVAPGAIVDQGMSIFYNNATTTLISLDIFYKVTKRSPPSIICYAPATGVSGYWSDGNSNVNVAVNIVSPGQRGFGAYVATASNLARLKGHWTADARL